MQKPADLCKSYAGPPADQPIARAGLAPGVLAWCLAAAVALAIGAGLAGYLLGR